MNNKYSSELPILFSEFTKNEETRHQVDFHGKIELYRWNNQNNSEVILKTDYSHTSKHKFWKEYELTKKLLHKNIVQVYGYTFNKNLSAFSMVMEYSVGNLYDFIKQDQELAMRCKWCLDILNAVKFLHHDLPKPLIHGNINLSTILVFGDTDGNILKLSDFRSASTEDYHDNIFQYSQSFRKKAKKDVWDVAVICYEVLCGRVGARV